jgi:hypothetical protein
MANSVITEAGSLDIVVFESVIDTFAGGGCLEVTGYTNSNNIIPAGTMVGAKDPTTGLHPIVGFPGTGTFTAPPFGFTHATIPLVTAGNNWAGIVIEGVVRKAALPAGAPNATDLAALKTALPKITMV